MQTLGLSNTRQSDNVLKRLFWPSIQSASDVDSIGSQGYWVCTAVGVLSFVVFLVADHVTLGTLFLLFYYLGGAGVREYSRYAGAAVFVLYAVNTALSPGILSILICGLLLSNLRATWIAAQWKPGSADAEMPMRFGDTWGEKFADKLPQWLWPKVRIPFYLLSGLVFLLEISGVLLMLFRRIS